jgi:hypothetical protein
MGPKVTFEYTRTCYQRNQVLAASTLFEDGAQAAAPWFSGTLQLHAFCQLFASVLLPTAFYFPSIHIEGRPARLVMAGNRYLNQCRMNGSSTRTKIR